MSDHSTLLEWLALADARLAENERQIADQHRLLANLEKPGQGASELVGQARQLLVLMESNQLSHIKHRDQLRKQLADEQSD